MENGFQNLMENFLSLIDDRNFHAKQFWREQPVDCITFFVDYMGEKPFPGKQTEVLEAVNQILWYKVTQDEKICVKDLQAVTEMVIMFGKGSGKDFLASGILTYVCYLLCCLSDPQTYFGFGRDEPIDLINVAVNAYQANNVFFKKLKARLVNCKWFEKVNHAPIRYNQFSVTKNQVRFYKNITAHSAHSEAEAYEGFNPLVVIFDEIGGYDAEVAESIYATLRSSAISRYNERALMIFISYPRHADDFLMRKYKEYTITKDPQVWAIKGSSWEVNPRIKRESLEKDYDRDPEGSRLKYEVEPPAYAEGLFQFPEMIDKVVMIGKTSQCTNLLVQPKISSRLLGNGQQRHFIGIELHNLHLNPQFTYYIGGDGGVETDSYTLCLMHSEPMMIEVPENGEIVQRWVNKPVEDLLLEWKPNKKDRLPVDLLNVAEILEHICKQVYVKKALFDKFNSAEVVQRLMQFGVEAEDKVFSNPFQVSIYTNLKSLIYTGQISLLDHVVFDRPINANDELKHIKLINGNKIDHDKDKSKDFSDARASAAWICSMDEVEATKHFSLPSIAGVQRKNG